MKFWRLSGLCLLLFCLSTSLLSAAETPAEMQFTVGLQGTYKIGCWTEVRVAAQGQPSATHLVQVNVLDADGNYVGYQSGTLTAGADGRVTGTVPIRIERVNSDVIVRLYLARTPEAGSAETDSAETATPAKSQPRQNQAGELLEERRIPPRSLTELSQHHPWIVAVGEVGGLEVTTDFVTDLHVSVVEDPSQLPQDPLCWQGIDALFTALTDQSAETIQKYQAWVQAGGDLILFPGIGAEEFLNSPLVKALPVSFDGISQIRDLSRMVSFVGEPSPLRVGSLTIPRQTGTGSQALIGGSTGPIVTLTPWGLGRVTVLSVNLNENVFQAWTALPQLYRLLAQLPGLQQSDQEGRSNLLTQNGLTDFKTQFDAALANFGVATPSVWIPLGSLLLAALLMGPIDYFLVRYVFKRPWLTWITFPLLLCVTVGWGLASTANQRQRIATPAAASLSEGVDAPATAAEEPVPTLSAASLDQVLCNQCLVVDYALDTNSSRYHGFLKYRFPQTGRYQIETELTLPQTQPQNSMTELFSPGAVPEPSFRGYYRPSGTHLDQTEYQILPEERTVLGAPAYENSTLMFELLGQTDWRANESAAPVLQADLVSLGSNQLRGSLTTQLDFPIENWVLAYGRLLYFVRDDHPAAELAPGETITFPDRAIDQKELSAYLTGTTTQLVKRKGGVGEDLLVRRLSYNPFSTDLDYILPILTFHTSLGGRQYTALTNVELGSWDFTPLLDLNRAVLLGRVKTSSLKSTADQEMVETTQKSTYVRIVIPVEQRGQTPERLPEYDKEK